MDSLPIPKIGISKKGKNLASKIAKKLTHFLENNHFWQY